MTGLLLAADRIKPVNLTSQTRLIAAGIGLILLVAVFETVRRHHLQERYAVIWVFGGLGIIAGAAFPSLLTLLTQLLGVRDTNVAFFFVAVLIALALAFHFSVTVSRQSEQLTRLAQESALEHAERQLHGVDWTKAGAPARGSHGGPLTMGTAGPSRKKQARDPDD